jgi:hypothetical protein
MNLGGTEDRVIRRASFDTGRIPNVLHVLCGVVVAKSAPAAKGKKHGH